MKEKIQYDAIIIGSGIAGMTSAIYLKRGGLKILLIEENAPGGQLNKINSIENYPGYLNITGPSLASEIWNQITSLNIEILYDKVIETDLKTDIKKVITSNKELTCKYLIIATGRLSKKLLETDREYIGKGISYCALCDGSLYKDKTVAVVGGGNSALEEALYLSDICKKVYLIIRSNKFKGDKILIDQVLNKKNIYCMYNLNVLEYNIENSKLISILLDDNSILEIDGLFISIGSEPSAKIFEVKKDKGFIVVDNKCMTNIENVYACGDVIKKDVYQLTTASAEGTIVAYDIIRKNRK